MQQYESDYDDYVKKLKKASSQKSSDLVRTKAEAAQADQTVKQAEDNKAGHLAQKAKDLINKNGGIDGIKSTIANVTKYFKSNPPSDYSVNMGGADNSTNTNSTTAAANTIMGMPSAVVYVGGALLLVGILYGVSQLINKQPAQGGLAQQTLQPAQ